MKGRRSRRQLMLLTFITILLINYNVSAAESIQNEHVCKSIDVRNTVSNFKVYLENCTVIEGYLRILLIDRAQPSDYANLTFPKLREITDYFLLFRVAGLKSLRNLFPNLSVIRGRNLFHNFAFVTFEMLDLQEIGLPKLTDIIRGGVRIEKNPNLCYIDTVDWDLIAKRDAETHLIKANSDVNECPNTCPENKQCPQSRKVSKKNALLCWSGYDCQKICEVDKCAVCEDNLKNCCHPQCLGGCNGTSQADCYVCKNFLFQGKCVESCPHGTFEFNNRRCLTQGECIAMEYFDMSEGKKVVFKPISLSNDVGGKCASNCPNGFSEDLSNATRCVKCEGSCPKECFGKQITSIADAQSLAGCTKINGHLDIQITGGKNVVKELQTHLEKIKEITDYLKVVRNVPIVSLNFLKGLEIIGGRKKHSDMYALYVLDNRNLEYLWDWNRGMNLTIESGKVFFHYNPKLCLEKIIELENITKAEKSDEKDVSKQSNGNRMACKVTTLTINVNKTAVDMAIIKWQNFLNFVTDQRSVLGYLVSYKEAPFENVTIFDDHDACSTESWKVIDFPVDGNTKSHEYETGLITNLKPFTKYAVYVKTYTVANVTNGGESKIIYFSTSPTIPTPPVDVKVFSKSPNELIVTWRPPKYPNGFISHYIVRWTRKEDSQEFLDMRNYCTEPLTKVDSKHTKSTTSTKDLSVNGTTSSSIAPESGKCCACPKDKKQLEEENAERQYQIQFENFLHNHIYVKRPDDKNEKNQASDAGTERMKRTSALIEEDDIIYRTRRNVSQRGNIYAKEANNGSNGLKDQFDRSNALPTRISTAAPTNKSIDDASQTNRNKSTIKNGTNNTSEFGEIVIKSDRQLNATIFSLKHFSEYIIEVIACQDLSGGDMPVCSGEAIVTARTKHTELVDDINSTFVGASVQNGTTNGVMIHWKSPPDPNGLILSFNVEIKILEADSSSHSNSQFCITHKEYLIRNGYIANGLLAGNYSLRLRATSLAGPGEWTSPTYFIIPEPSSGLGVEIYVAIGIAVVVFLVCVFGGTTFYIRKRYGSRVPDIMYASVNPEYLSNMYVPDEWEIPREKIAILKELGQGSFGMVYEGKAKDIHPDLPFVRCAVKTVNETASLRNRIEFLNEASVMKAFSCHHVVKLLGVVSKGQPTLVVMELMANGDLKSYLRSHRPDTDDNAGRQPPTLKKMLQIAIEIADGMAYLSEKKFVHRDLAARNCMVSEALTVKIGDFGMTRDIYETDYYRKGGKGLLPVRWMAPESLKDGVFTSQSDVWSYGIVLWEMATLASQPYQGLSNEQVLKYVIDGGVMEKPENCPEKLYELMRGCFHYNPKLRMTFIDVIENLLPEANANFSQVSFYFNGHNNGERDYNNQDNFDDDDGGEGASPSTPLKSPQNDTIKNDNLRDEGSGESQNPSSTYTKHFRLQNKHPNKHHHHRSLNRYQNPLSLIGGPTNENGNKGVPAYSSDGGKTNTCSANGSIPNGHIGGPLSINRTAEC